MKEKLNTYLKDICSSSNVLKASDKLSEEQAAKLFNIVNEWSLGDAIIFYLCVKPEAIIHVKKDLDKNGCINPVFENMIYIEAQQLGYC